MRGISKPDEERKQPMETTTRPRFVLGRILATPGALEFLSESNQIPLEYIGRHARGDWGCVGESDRQANEDALRDGARILSAYRTARGRRIWIITEAADARRNRAATTVLLPDEY